MLSACKHRPRHTSHPLADTCALHTTFDDAMLHGLRSHGFIECGCTRTQHNCSCYFLRIGVEAARRPPTIIRFTEPSTATALARALGLSMTTPSLIHGARPAVHLCTIRAAVLAAAHAQPAGRESMSPPRTPSWGIWGRSCQRCRLAQCGRLALWWRHCGACAQTTAAGGSFGSARQARLSLKNASNKRTCAMPYCICTTASTMHCYIFFFFFSLSFFFFLFFWFLMGSFSTSTTRVVLIHAFCSFASKNKKKGGGGQGSCSS